MPSDYGYESARRRFLKAGVVGTAGGILTRSTHADQKPSTGIRGYRRLGRTNLEISDISFGSSRLRSGETHLVHRALDLGINYFDSAASYTRGQSETVLGEALQGRRDKVVLVSKHVTHAEETADSMMQVLDASLKRLRTDYIDIFMNHAVNDIAVMKNPEWHEFVAAARRQGKIRFVGASGHAGRLIDCLDYALDEDHLDVILAAYNFGQDPKFYEGLTRSFDMVATQTDLPRVLSKAKQNDVGVVAMKTLMGARLNDMRPYERDGSTYAQAAFRWVLSNEHVDALIISMTSEAQIDEYVGASGARELAAGDLALLHRYAELNGSTYCRQVCSACDDACPYGVLIADVLRTRMYATDYRDVAFARDEYAQLSTDASACLSCSGQPCQGACPHGIAIHELCSPTHAMLA